MLVLAALLLQSCREGASILDAGAELPLSPAPTTLTPLASYRLEEVAGARVLWHPSFDTATGLQETVRAALASDIQSWAGTAPPALATRLSTIRIAVATTTHAVPDLPSKGRGLGFHRSAGWLAAHGLDAAREGVIEIYIRRVLDLPRDAADPPPAKECDPSGAASAPLSEYRAERLGGFVALWHPEIQSGADVETRVRTALRDDLSNIAQVVPAQAVRALEGTRIVVNLASFDESGAPKHGLGTHRSAEWLVEHGLDAHRAGVVEVYDANDYLASRTTQPMVVLHELSHVLQRKAPPSTLSALEDAFAAAVASHRYEAVQHVLEPAGGLRRAYALKNAGEYGAELAEALFGRNDNYPFVREDLVSFDALGCAAAARLWFADCPG